MEVDGDIDVLIEKADFIGALTGLENIELSAVVALDQRFFHGSVFCIDRPVNLIKSISCPTARRFDMQSICFYI